MRLYCGVNNLYISVKVYALNPALAWDSDVSKLVYTPLYRDLF